MKYASSHRIRNFSYILSQYSWILCAIIPLGYSILFPDNNPPQRVFSSQLNKSWNSDENPRLISHITDSHISSFEPETENTLKNMLNWTLFYQIKHVILTGDMVDNFDHNGFPKYSNQNINDWIMYKRIIDGYNDSIPYFIDLPGNHDLFGVYSLGSSSSYLLDYSKEFVRSNTMTLDDLQLRHVHYDGFSFIIINPFTYPTVHTPLMFWAEPTLDLLDRLEIMIDRYPNSFLLSHYPADMWSNKQSSRGSTFKQICGSSRIKAFFSGHSHPKTTQFLHQPGGGIESIGAGAFQHGVFSILTIDNGRISYHAIDGDGLVPDIIISHPVPLLQTSSRSCFSESSTEVRALVFSNVSKNIFVSGAVTGKLQFQRYISDGIQLYSLPMTLSNGIHSIEFSGDYYDTIKFVVNESYMTSFESKPAVPGTIRMLEYTLPVFWLILAFIVCPIDFAEADPVQEWIQYDNEDSNWIICFFFGPFVQRSRLSKLPRYVRITLFILVIAPLLIPTSIFETEANIGFIWTWGYFINGMNRWSKWCYFSTYFYLAIVIFPLLPLINSLSLSSLLHIGCIIDIILSLSSIPILYMFCRRFLVETIGFPLLFISPGFIISPIIIWIIVLSIVCKRNHTEYTIFA